MGVSVATTAAKPSLKTNFRHRISNLQIPCFQCRYSPAPDSEYTRELKNSDQNGFQLWNPRSKPYNNGMKNLFDLAHSLERKKVTSRELVQHCLHNVEAQGGEGHNTFLSVYKERALEEADACDAARRTSINLSPFSGIPISIKDLFDVAGQVTTAGSHVLDEQRPAQHDAPVISKLRQAGFIIIGKTNMTEFAYSGLGINSHYGTPASPYDRQTRRIPGGSSSGAAVSVSDEMAAAAIGTDTGGSTRIPAALCGLVGFKPTSERISTEGSVPLSPSLDSIGPIANSVSCCALLDAIMSGESNIEVEPFPEVGLRLGVLNGFAMEDLDSAVANCFEQAVQSLGKRGILIKSHNLPELESYFAHINRACLVGAEAYAYHRQLIDNREEFYDPWVLDRIAASSSYTATDYIQTLERRADCQQKSALRNVGLDAIVLPAVPLIPQPVASLINDKDLSLRVNGLNLRNTSIANTLNAPSITIPCHNPNDPPVGFMLIGKTGRDSELLSIASSIEPIIRKIN